MSAAFQIVLKRRSCLTGMKTVKKAADAGYKHYIIKPFNKENLLAKVRRTLEHEKPVLTDKNKILIGFKRENLPGNCPNFFVYDK